MGKANRIAVFADLHFTVESGRLKGDVLRWAVREASWRGCEAIVCAGDMIGSGRKAEAEAVAAILAESALPVSLTPGNAELRCPAESAEALAILAGAPPPEGVALEVKTAQDKLENNHAWAHVQIAGFPDIPYGHPNGNWERRWVELPAGVPEETSSLCIGVAPRGAKLTLWIRNVELLRFGVGDH